MRGLRCRGRHGAYPGEQDAPRTFLVDLAVEADLAPAVAQDRLDAALDLAALAATAREVVAGPPRTLLESVAVAIANAILERFPAALEARVRLVKPDPPGLDAADEAVELALRRDAAARV